MPLSVWKFQQLDIGNYDKNWKNETKDGSILDDSLCDTLYEDERTNLKWLEKMDILI